MSSFPDFSASGNHRSTLLLWVQHYLFLLDPMYKWDRAKCVFLCVEAYFILYLLSVSVTKSCSHCFWHSLPLPCYQANSSSCFKPWFKRTFLKKTFLTLSLPSVLPFCGLGQPLTAPFYSCFAPNGLWIPLAVGVTRDEYDSYPQHRAGSEQVLIFNYKWTNEIHCFWVLFEEKIEDA